MAAGLAPHQHADIAGAQRGPRRRQFVVVGAHPLDLGWSEGRNIPPRDMLIRDIIAHMRHDGCGGRAGKVELLTGGRCAPPFCVVSFDLMFGAPT